ncbi:MAG: DUF6502 family protein, partial [Gammaproteobacteria bacterium]
CQPAHSCMEQKHSDVISKAVMRLLRPLARILLREGASFETFSELAKRVFIDVAETEFTVENKKQSTARVSLLTGINRKEVARIRKLPSIQESEIEGSFNRAVEVISGWLRDAAFHDSSGEPLDLPFKGKGSFSELVRRYGRDMPPRAVADELLRVQAVELSEDKRMRLKTRGYVPSAGTLEKLQMLGTDGADLVAAIDHNLTHPPAEALFQRKTIFDDVPLEYVEEFRKLSAWLGKSVLRQLHEWLDERDRDSNKDVKGHGRAKLGLGIYQIEQILEDAEPKATDRETNK